MSIIGSYPALLPHFICGTEAQHKLTRKSGWLERLAYRTLGYFSRMTAVLGRVHHMQPLLFPISHMARAVWLEINE